MVDSSSKQGEGKADRESLFRFYQQQQRGGSRSLSGVRQSGLAKQGSELGASVSLRKRSSESLARTVASKGELSSFSLSFSVGLAGIRPLSSAWPALRGVSGLAGTASRTSHLPSTAADCSLKSLASSFRGWCVVSPAGGARASCGLRRLCQNRDS